MMDPLGLDQREVLRAVAELLGTLLLREITAADLAERERAFDEMVARARADLTAREALEGWAEGADELAWTARLALRELRQRGGLVWRPLHVDQGWPPTGVQGFRFGVAPQDLAIYEELTGEVP